MILIILILAAIAFIYFNVIPKKGHTPLAILSLIITALCVVGIVAHDYNHFGMKVQTSTQTQKLVSTASPKLPMLLYQPLGNGTEKVYLYKTKSLQKKPVATKTDKSSAKVIVADRAKLVTKTQRYTYSNKMSQFLFGLFGHDQELKSRHYLFYVPKNWKVLSVKQAKKLEAELKKQQALMKKKMLMQKKMQMQNKP